MIIIITIIIALIVLLGTLFFVITKINKENIEKTNIQENSNAMPNETVQDNNEIQEEPSS